MGERGSSSAGAPKRVRIRALEMGFEGGKIKTF
jgi:hypothetical protein